MPPTPKPDPLFFILGNRGYIQGAFKDGLNDAMKIFFKNTGLGIHGKDAKQGVEVAEYHRHDFYETLAANLNRYVSGFAEEYQRMVVELLGERLPNVPYTEPKGYAVTYGGDIQELLTSSPQGLNHS